MIVIWKYSFAPCVVLSCCRIELMIASLKEDGLEPRTLLLNLEYVHEVLSHLVLLKKE